MRMIGRQTPSPATASPLGWTTTGRPAAAGCKGATPPTELHLGVHQIEYVPEHRSSIPMDPLSNHYAAAKALRDPFYQRHTKVQERIVGR